jgi:spore germination protein
MNKKESILLSSSETTFLLVSFLLGSGFFKLPNLISEISKQDAWISALLGVLYPLYIVLIICYIIKKHPQGNILTLSKKIFGKILGTILNCIFLVQWILVTIGMTSDFVRISTVYFIAFLTPLKVVIVVVALFVYASSKGLKTLAKSSQIVILGLLFIMVISTGVLRSGSILNLQPVFGSGLTNIIAGIKPTFSFYLGFEALAVFYPNIYDGKTIKKASLKAVLICTVIWVWINFITVYNMGIYTIPKHSWAFIAVFESIQVKVITSFRYIFMVVWCLVSIQSISNWYYTSSFIINDITKIKMNIINLCLYPVIVFLSLKLMSELVKKATIDILSPICLVFNIFYFTLIAVIVYFKSNKANSC